MNSEALSALTSVAGGVLALLMLVAIPTVAVSTWRQRDQASLLAHLLDRFESLEALASDRLAPIARQFSEQDETVPPLVQLTRIMALTETIGVPWRVPPTELVELHHQVHDVRIQLTQLPAHLFWKSEKLRVWEYSEVEARVNRSRIIRQLAEMEAIEAKMTSSRGYL